jgi:hypothetical protein
MSDLRTAAQQALEQLRCNTDNMEKGMSKSIQKLCAKENREAMDTLRAALAQQTQTPCDIAEDGVCEVIDCCGKPPQRAQEPVAWLKTMYSGTRPMLEVDHLRKATSTPVYTTPPRREWQGLKEWEINDGRDQLPTEDLCGWSFRQGVYFAEKALKERNNG